MDKLDTTILLTAFILIASINLAWSCDINDPEDCRPIVWDPDTGTWDTDDY